MVCIQSFRERNPRKPDEDVRLGMSSTCRDFEEKEQMDLNKTIPKAGSAIWRRRA